MGAPSQHYLLLDGAQIDDLFRRVYELEAAPEFHLLYQQTQYADLADVGPMLIRAESDSDLYSEFQTHWMRNAGVALESAMPEALVVEHLRSLVHLRGGGETTLLFRYYDPRVLRLWLGSLGHAELARFMGPISAMQVFDPDTGLTKLYQSPGQDEGQVYDRNPWLHLSSEQLDVLNGARQQAFDQRLIEHVNRWFPECLAGADDQQRRQWAAQCRGRAAQYGYSSANEVARWSGFVALMGIDFPDALEHEAFRQVLSRRQITATQRLDEIMVEIQRHMLTQDKEPVA